LSESVSRESRPEWIAALDKIEVLEPRAVIAGHKRRDNHDAPRIIEEALGGTTVFSCRRATKLARIL
jgi:hypothetical protein